MCINKCHFWTWTWCDELWLWFVWWWKWIRIWNMCRYGVRGATILAYPHTTSTNDNSIWECRSGGLGCMQCCLVHNYNAMRWNETKQNGNYTNQCNTYRHVCNMAQYFVRLPSIRCTMKVYFTSVTVSRVIIVGVCDCDGLVQWWNVTRVSLWLRIGCKAHCWNWYQWFEMQHCNALKILSSADEWQVNEKQWYRREFSHTFSPLASFISLYLHPYKINMMPTYKITACYWV